MNRTFNYSLNFSLPPPRPSAITWRCVTGSCIPHLIHGLVFIFAHLSRGNRYLNSLAAWWNKRYCEFVHILSRSVVENNPFSEDERKVFPRNWENFPIFRKSTLFAHTFDDSLCSRADSPLGIRKSKARGFERCEIRGSIMHSECFACKKGAYFGVEGVEFVWGRLIRVVFTEEKRKFEKLIVDTTLWRIRKARGFLKMFKNAADFNES